MFMGKMRIIHWNMEYPLFRQTQINPNMSSVERMTGPPTYRCIDGATTKKFRGTPSCGQLKTKIASRGHPQFFRQTIMAQHDLCGVFAFNSLVVLGTNL